MFSLLMSLQRFLRVEATIAMASEGFPAVFCVNISQHFSGKLLSAILICARKFPRIVDFVEVLVEMFAGREVFLIYFQTSPAVCNRAVEAIRDFRRLFFAYLNLMVGNQYVLL